MPLPHDHPSFRKLLPGFVISAGTQVVLKVAKALPNAQQFKEGERDEVYWELEKFLRLALKANPNVLETLWTPLVLLADETAQELRAMRQAFLSKHVYKTYSGYVLSQFRRMANAYKDKGTYKPKHAMHLIRLLHSGIAALETGEIRIDVAEHRDELLHIRNDGLPFEEVKRRALELDEQFQQAFERTALPEQPDYAAGGRFPDPGPKEDGRCLTWIWPPCGGSSKGWTTGRCSSPSAGRTSTASRRPTATWTCGAATSCRCGTWWAWTCRNQTLEHKTVHDGTEVELVSHEVGKYLRLLVRNNGYILEQIFSPIVVLGQEFLDELRPLARRCITRHHYHHYRGFYATQRKLIAKEEPKRAKPVLYAYRVLMTGIHLLRTGEVEANLLRLNEHFGFGFLDELIARKVGGENTSVGDLDWSFHEARLAELEARLDQAFAESPLPEDRDRKAISEFLVRLRLGPQ